MPELEGGSRLAELEARWRTDRSPRVFLQLADELRRLGQLSRAVLVLEEGVRAHPESVSGHVALGRGLLENGDSVRAAEILDLALARDPAQLVANKLAIEARIRMGDAARARERLAVYRILQDRDVEIETLERRIGELDAARRDRDVAAPPPPVISSPSPAEILFDLPPPDRVAALELALSPSEPAAAGQLTGAGVDRVAPFGSIFDSRADGSRIDSFFSQQGIFSTAAGIEAPETSLAGAAVDLSWQEQSAETPDLTPAKPEPAPPPAAFYSTRSFAEEVEREAASDPAPAAASSTLAELYLRQGHLEDAEKEFGAVVEARPDDAVALAGLAAISAVRGRATSAAGGKSVATVPTAPPVAATPIRSVGLTRRKIELLRGELERIRRGRRRAHVS